MSAKPTITEGTIADLHQIEHIGQLHPDPKNARRHNPRNIGMIVSSLQEVGAARSIVIDENDEVLAGNGVLEAAALAGIEKVQVVEADGETIIAVRRVGLTPEQRKKLALFDNRAGELSDFDPAEIAALAEQGLDMTPFFNDLELTRILSTAGSALLEEEATTTELNADLQEETPSSASRHRCPKCGYEWRDEDVNATAF